MQGRAVLKSLVAAAVVGAAYAAAIAWTGGFDLRFAGIRIRSHSWVRPALMAAAFAGAAALIGRARLADFLSRAGAVLDTAAASRAMSAAAVLWTLAAAAHYGAFTASGSDAYGYVSQAMLFANGRLTDEVRVDPRYTWPRAHQTLTPLGYVPGTRAGVIAPSYPPGLPLLMAPAAWLWPAGVYLVVPLLGACAVWSAYRLGVAAGDPLGGASAALLLSASPTFLMQLVQPMSDVPATACWLGALVFAARGSAGAPWVAGAAAAVAILVRPNLAPLAAFVAALAAFAGPAAGRYRRALVVLVMAVPGVAVLAGVQWVRYGSPLSSGYGGFDYLFSTTSIGPNLQRYPRWLTETHTPFIWLWLAAPLALRSRMRDPLIAVSFAMIVALFALYLPYAYFQMHEWQYTRFLLPAIPLMLLLGAIILLSALRRAGASAAAVAMIALVLGLGFAFLRGAAARDVFRMRVFESKYSIVGEHVQRELPRNAIVLAAQHSGGIRYYGRRPILRWDLLEPDALDTALDAVRRVGQVPFLVVEGFEYEAFQRKFSGQASASRTQLLAVPRDVRVYAFN